MQQAYSSQYSKVQNGLQLNIQAEIRNINCIYPENLKYFVLILVLIFIPHATSCRGYNVFDPSVS